LSLHHQNQQKLSVVKKLAGDFWAFSLAPVEGTIAMDFPTLKSAQDYVAKINACPDKQHISHWNMMGIVDDELCVVYEERNGQVLKNLFMS
jgi:hypothetical protein